MFDETKDFADKLFARKRTRSPYYIVTPRYFETSAGVKVAHHLCHLLNMRGCAAYIVVFPDLGNYAGVSPNLFTPVLSIDLARAHADAGLVPILVYPETIHSNFLTGGINVRYLLTYIGILGGPTTFKNTHYQIAYSRNIADKSPGCTDVMYLPVADPEVFKPDPTVTERKGICTYAGKYVTFYQQKLPEALTRDATVIHKHGPHVQSRAEIVRLFQTSEAFHVFENTSLITEALLSGCPVVCHKNPYFTETIAAREQGEKGLVWSDDPESLARARAEVGEFRADYARAVAQLETDLDHFVCHTQNLAIQTPGVQPILLKAHRLLTTYDWFATRGRAALLLMREHGFFKATWHIILALGRRALGRRK